MGRNRSKKSSFKCTATLIQFQISNPATLRNPRNHMSYTLGEAAKATGKNKTTIQRAIKSGKISAIQHENGSYSIEPAELSRVYKLQPLSNEDRATPRLYATQSNPSVLQLEVVRLQERVNSKEDIIQNLQQQLSDKKREAEDAKLERDRWQEEAAQWRKLLTSNTKQDSGSSATVTMQQGGFWKWLLGR